MTNLEIAAWLGLSFVGAVGTAIASGAEMGAYSVNRVRLNLRASGTAAGGNAGRSWPTAKILRQELDHSPRLLATILITYNIASYLGAVGLTTVLTEWKYSEGAIILLNTLVVGPVLFVVADSLPKEIFRAEADRIMYAIAPLLSAVRRLLTWTAVLPLVQLVADAIERLVPGGGLVTPETSRQRIAALLKEGTGHGVISENQATLLDRALSLRQTRVGDEMVPWIRCRVIGIDWDRRRTLEFIALSNSSRFPVVDQRGAVVGIADHLDLCTTPDARPADVVRPAITLAPETTIRDALLQMKATGARLAIVMDKGKPAGLVTTKDLVEPLTGELLAW